MARFNDVSLGQLLDCIETRQAVLNKDELTAHLSKCVQGVASLQTASVDDVAFLAKSSYKDSLSATQAGVVLVDKHNQDGVPATAIAVVVSSPYLAYASISQLFTPKPVAFIHPTAIIGSSVSLGQSVNIGAYAVIGDRAVIGDNVSIGQGVHIGQGTVIEPLASIAHECIIGEQCRIHSHASIGSEGFGFAPSGNPSVDGWERIAQLGRVQIGNRVRIGANTCIDRGAIDDTVIGDDVIIDNLVQIAHNVHIGNGTAIAAKTGIAGSTKIGKGCIIGGAVGISGHLTIGDFVTITAMTMVIKSIDQSGSYSSGTAAMPTAQWRRAAVKFRQMGNH